MLSRSCAALLCVVVLAVTTTASSGEIAPTPPMGWNSWDAFGLTINEADFKANAAQLAKLRSYGWSYAVIDEGWYLGNPFGNSLRDRQYLLNEHGQLIPVGARFPSSNDGRGFKPLGDWVHAQGLKFGIHIIRGIPKEAVTRNTPIANSAFHAADAVGRAPVTILSSATWWKMNSTSACEKLSRPARAAGSWSSASTMRASSSPQ